MNKRQQRQAKEYRSTVESKADDNAMSQKATDAIHATNEWTRNQPPLFVDVYQSAFYPQPSTDGFPTSTRSGYCHNHLEKSLDPPDLFF
jgi:hypothetical protein